MATIIPPGSPSPSTRQVRAHSQVGANLPAFNGTDAWGLPMAGTFPVERSGTVHLAFVDPDFIRRLDPSVIVARLNELKD